MRVCDGTGGTWVHIQCVMAEVVESEVAQVKVGVASVYCTREVGKAVDQANGIKGVAKSGREAARHFEKLAQTVIETHLVQAWDVCVGYVYEGLQRLGEVLHVADDRLKEAREQARDVQLHILEGNTQIAVRRINRGIRRDIAEVPVQYEFGVQMRVDGHIGDGRIGQVEIQTKIDVGLALERQPGEVSRIGIRVGAESRVKVGSLVRGLDEKKPVQAARGSESQQPDVQADRQRGGRDGDGVV